MKQTRFGELHCAVEILFLENDVLLVPFEHTEACKWSQVWQVLICPETDVQIISQTCILYMVADKYCGDGYLRKIRFVSILDVFPPPQWSIQFCIDFWLYLLDPSVKTTNLCQYVCCERVLTLEQWGDSLPLPWGQEIVGGAVQNAGKWQLNHISCFKHTWATNGNEKGQAYINNNSAISHPDLSRFKGWTCCVASLCFARCILQSKGQKLYRSILLWSCCLRILKVWAGSTPDLLSSL